MTGLQLRVSSDNFKIKIPLERRITYLRGDSGVGKTTLVEMISMRIKDRMDFISVELDGDSSYDIDILSSLSKTLDIENKYHSLLLIDDNVNTEEVDFSNAVVNHLVKNDLYLLIINRVNIYSDPTDTAKRFDFAVNSILYVDKIKGNIERKVYTILGLLPVTNSISDVEYILGEDTYGISEFCRTYNKSTKEIDSTLPKSKDNILDILIAKEGCYKKVFLFVDLACFGKYIEKLFFYARTCGYEIVLDRNYESFEYMILMSNPIRNHWKMSSVANSYFSWEKYFEHELSNIPQEYLPQKYRHKSSSPVCLLKDCKDCDILDRCKNIMGDNKLEMLFKGTGFEYLINFLGGDKQC